MEELAFVSEGLGHLNQVVQTQLPAIEAAAQLCADSLSKDGVIQAFGTGHSRAVTLELAGRAGGMASVGMLAVKDLVMFGGESPDTILDPTFERQSGLAERIYELAKPTPGDVFVIDNVAPVGDATVEILPQVRIGPVSTLTGVFIAQLLTEAICRKLLAKGQELPIYLSANLPDGDRVNSALYTKYGTRIRPIEP